MNFMRIREATAEDAAAVIALFQQLYSETRFLLYEPGESVPGVEEYTRRITDIAHREDGVMLLADIDPGLVGVIFGNRGTARKTRHALSLAMGVPRIHWNHGVGRSLLQAVESWAIAKGLHRLELTVQTTNARAIALYERAGFEREGMKRHSLRVEGQYVDEWLMSKLIGT